jgi:hypothetical protein
MTVNCLWVFPPYTRVAIFPQKSEPSPKISGGPGTARRQPAPLSHPASIPRRSRIPNPAPNPNCPNHTAQTQAWPHARDQHTNQLKPPRRRAHASQIQRWPAPSCHAQASEPPMPVQATTTYLPALLTLPFYQPRASKRMLEWPSMICNVAISSCLQSYSCVLIRVYLCPPAPPHSDLLPYPCPL